MINENVMHTYILLIIYYFCNILDTICISGEATTTPAPPPSLQYNVEVRLLRLGEGFTVPRPGSTDFDILSKSVGSALSSGAVGKVPGFNDIVVKEFKQ
jgi:hypothetical protein